MTRLVSIKLEFKFLVFSSVDIHQLMFIVSLFDSALFLDFEYATFSFSLQTDSTLVAQSKNRRKINPSKVGRII